MVDPRRVRDGRAPGEVSPSAFDCKTAGRLVPAWRADAPLRHLESRDAMAAG